MEQQEPAIQTFEKEVQPITGHPEAKSLGLERFYYDNKIVRDFAIASVSWGVISLLVGVFIASQLLSLIHI